MPEFETAASEEFKVRKRIDAFLEQQFELSHWTPAQGVLLVAGVMAPLGCQDIPSEAISLIDPTTPATEKQLSDARKILDELREGWDENEETRKYLAPDAKIEFMIFLHACYELCRECEYLRPGFYTYFYDYCGWNDGTSSIPFATREMVRQGVLMDGVIKLRPQKAGCADGLISSNIQLGDPEEIANQEKINSVIRAIRGGASIAYENALIGAIKSSASLKPRKVWDALPRVAGDSDSGLTPGRDGAWNYTRADGVYTITLSIVEQALGRAKRRVAKDYKKASE